MGDAGRELFAGATRGVSNVLMLAPARSDSENEACIDLLTISDIAHENVLAVTLTQSVEDRLTLWHTHAGEELPARGAIIATEQQSQSVGATQPPPLQTADSIAIDTVPDPAALTDLGVSLTNYLSDWSENDNQTVVCFHSLTPLLQYVGLDRAFKFLHILSGRVDMLDAVAHYHMDPSAHDEQTRMTLLQLCDAVVELDPDEGRSVRYR